MVLLGLLFFIALCTAAGASIGVRTGRSPALLGLAGFGIGIAVTASLFAYFVWIWTRI